LLVAGDTMNARLARFEASLPDRRSSSSSQTVEMGLGAWYNPVPLIPS
jgi:hypothetical protein